MEKIQILSLNPEHETNHQNWTTGQRIKFLALTSGHMSSPSQYSMQWNLEPDSCGTLLPAINTSMPYHTYLTAGQQVIDRCELKATLYNEFIIEDFATFVFSIEPSRNTQMEKDRQEVNPQENPMDDNQENAVESHGLFPVRYWQRSELLETEKELTDEQFLELITFDKINKITSSSGMIKGSFMEPLNLEIALPTPDVSTQPISSENNDPSVPDIPPSPLKRYRAVINDSFVEGIIIQELNKEYVLFHPTDNPDDIIMIKRSEITIQELNGQ